MAPVCYWCNRATCYTFAFVDFKLQVVPGFIQLHINTTFFWPRQCENTCCSSAGDQALMDKGLAGASTSRREVGAMSAEACQGWIHDTRCYFLQCQSGSVVFQAEPLAESQRFVPQGAISSSLTMPSQLSSQDKYRLNSCSKNSRNSKLKGLNSRLYVQFCYILLFTLKWFSPVSFLLKHLKADWSLLCDCVNQLWHQTPKLLGPSEES